jgi:hypothetical protein
MFIDIKPVPACAAALEWRTESTLESKIVNQTGIRRETRAENPWQRELKSG